MEMVVIRKGNGEDNGVMVFMENPAILQEFVKRVNKRVIHWIKIIEYNYLNELLCKIRIIHKIRFKAF